MELGSGCRVPGPQTLVSCAMGAMDTAESRSSSLMSDNCEGKKGKNGLVREKARKL